MHIKKKKLMSITIVLLLVLSLMGCVKATIPEADSLNTYNDHINHRNKYNIEVVLDTKEMTYEGIQNVKYTNNSSKELKNLYFHLYPNTFSSFEEAPILFSLAENMSKSSYESGYIQIEDIKINDKTVHWSLEGDKKTLLNIKLNTDIKTGENVDVYLKYKVNIPTAKDRFGYFDTSANLGNWYPILAVYDENGWNLDPYYKIGDPFYSNVSDYDVKIKVPKNYSIAISGNIISEEIIEDYKEYQIKIENIRDIAWSVSDKFILKEEDLDGINIKVYSIKNDEEMIKKSLEYGKQSLEIFNKIYGKYPYDSYSIVITEFPSGMEYPGLALISVDYLNKDFLNVLETIIVHETAHQWWYATVGSNQVKEPWLDEGLATYSEVIYVDELKGEDSAKNYYDTNIKLGYEYMMQYLEGNTKVDRPLSEFTSWDDYGVLAYARSSMFINQIKEIYGKETLYKIISTYYNEYKFKNAKGEDFIKICEDIIGEPIDKIVDEYLKGK